MRAVTQLSVLKWDSAAAKEQHCTRSCSCSSSSGSGSRGSKGSTQRSDRASERTTFSRRGSTRSQGVELLV